MGRDVTLYPENATKKQLKEYIEGLGFEKCGHFWDWPNGTLNYSWFDYNDFKSIDGVSADIYPVSEDELDISGNTWALHVRNVYSASWYDVKMLNDVLRGARKLFGGTIQGDYGTNRYAPLWEDTSTPISRGVSAIYQQVERELSAVKHALPNPSLSHPPQTGEKIEEFIEYTKSLDPSRVIYNGLVPFAVAMFEYFFSQIFQVLIAYDKYALDKRKSYKMKVEFSTLLEVGSKDRTIENIIAGSYTFQNMNQLNKAYQEWLGIDVRKILYKKRKIGNSITFLENKISEIIQYRHGIVHHFAIDRSLTKDGYIHILEAIEKTMLEFIGFIEKKYVVKIELY
ncbi:MAG: HEPN domain-containing protein [Methylococcaceae bacterium]